MSKPLSELRQSPASLAERVERVCLAQHLVAEVQALDAELAEIKAEAATNRDDGASAKPRKVSQGANPRAAEIETRLEELYDEMRDHTGDLRLRAIPAGEWMRWATENPAREDNKIDAQVTYGFADADALVNDLGRYVASWDGEPASAEDRDFILSRITVGDLKKIASTVVQMHEGEGAVPKSRRASSVEQTSESA